MKIKLKELTQLGKSELQVSRVGMGTNRWDFNTAADPDLKATFSAAIENGINFIDTAEIYSMGGSEKELGKFISAVRSKVVIASKFNPLPWRLSKSSLEDALRASLARLQIERNDLYMLHFPNSPVPLETWADALADAYENGLTRAVGISNCNIEQMERVLSVLEKRDVPLASNQVEYSLLKRGKEFSGLLE